MWQVQEENFPVQFESNNFLLEQDSLDKIDNCSEVNIYSTGTGVQTLNESPHGVDELLKVIGETKYTVREVSKIESALRKRYGIPSDERTSASHAIFDSIILEQLKEQFRETTKLPF